MASDTINNPTTYVDGEIETLEARKAELQQHREKLLAGEVAVEGFEGQQFSIDVSGFAPGEEGQRRLAEVLNGTPIFDELKKASENRETITNEMIAAGILPPRAGKLNTKGNLLRANYRFSKWIEKKAKFLSFLNTPWVLIGIAIICLLLWAGGPLLYMVSGGNFGGQNIHHNADPTATTPAPTTANQTGGKLTPGSNITTSQHVGVVNNENKISYSYIMAEPDPAITNTNTTDVTNTNSTGSSQDATATPDTTPDTADRVGQSPSNAGGFNGPHGAFLAPSQLTIPALKVDVNIRKALTQEEVVTTTGQTETNILWPRFTDKEIAQAGAFPGEVGNCLLFGTQETLSQVRYIQQNDEIHLLDRNNNLFVYRVISLSQTGEPERVIDLNKDGWIFQPQPGQALLTIIVSMPLTPTLETLATATSQQTDQTTVPQEDLTTNERLAYRAVLVSYSPAKVKQTGTPVEVPPNVWAVPQIKESVTITGTNTGADLDDQKGGDQSR